MVDTEIKFTDQTDLSNPNKSEEFWIDPLKNVYPVGLNNIEPLLLVSVVAFSEVTNVFTKDVIF